MKKIKFLFWFLAVFGAADISFAQSQNEIKETDYKVYCPTWDNLFFRYVCVAQNARNSKDWKNSFESYKKLADYGFPEAHYELARQFFNGLGVEQNKATAYAYAKTAALNGNIWAQHMLSKMYLQGEGVERNIEKAYLWSYMTIVGTPDFLGKDITSMHLDKNIAPELNDSQIKNSKNAAQICKLTNYKTCD